MTITVGVRELNHRTGKLIREAAAGTTIVVTDNGKPVADITQHVGRGSLAGLVAVGLLDKVPEPATGHHYGAYGGPVGDLNSLIHGEDMDEVW